MRAALAASTRITPACAGKTLGIGRELYTAPDHPRVCGENSAATIEVVVKHGSPPRVRGKHFAVLCDHFEQRITPACAGKTRRTSTRFSGAPDHPRVCGENFDMIVVDELSSGSPPRVRGKRHLRAALAASMRITPACAGKTRRGKLRHRFIADHPRVCGEN